MRSSVRKRLVRATWGVADQALSSVMGLGLSVVVAHLVDAGQFGAFAFALAVYYVGLGSSRALSSEIIMVRFSGDANGVDSARAQATGMALVVGGAFGVVLCALSVFVSGELRAALLAIALVFPALLLQDMMRFAFFAARRGATTFVIDLVWVCSCASLVALTLLAGVRDAAVFIVEWGVAAGFAAAIGLRIVSCVPQPAACLSWLRQHRDLGPRFLAEITLSTSVGSLTLVLVGAVAGLGAAGALRGATVLLGPLTVMFLASTMFGIPEAVEARARSDRALRMLTIQVSALLTLVALVWTVALVVLPAKIGRLALDASWPGAHHVVLPMGLATCGVAAIAGAFIGLRALAAARESLNVRMVTAPLVVVAVVAGAVTGGAVDAAFGMAIANWVAAVIGWRAFAQALTGRRHPRVVDVRATPHSAGVASEGGAA